MNVALVKKESVQYFRFVSASNDWKRLEDNMGRGIFFVSGSEFAEPHLDNFYQVTL